MTKHQSIEMADKQSDTEFHEAIIIGTGMCGLYQLYKLREAGFDVIAADRNADVGGTWFNNRYPGCRFDSESYTYGFSTNKMLLDEWDWKERFSPQPDNYEYTKFVTEKLDLRPHIRFGLELDAAYFDEAASHWHLEFANGQKMTCQFLITALGGLSHKTLPRIEGMADFDGPSFHTFDWPHEPLDLKGKRVGVVGTGATGVQIIQTIASEVDQLYVFQRRPNWCAPLNNSKLSREDMDEIRSRFDDIFAICAQNPGGFEHSPDRRGFYSVTREERLELWDRLYDEPGFTALTGNFVDIFTDENANKEFSEYIADRIRKRVDDPETAEALIPTDHGFGVQRIPLETRYFETYNRDNVHLVQLLKEPITRIVPEGIQTSDRLIELDVIVYATGFDAGVGSYNNIDIRGLGGKRLREKWDNGPSTLYGTLTSGFPNLVHPAGPQSGGAAINYPRAIEMCVDWVTGLLTHMRENGLTQFNVTQEAEDDWVKEASRARDKLLSRKAMNWGAGVNKNIDGRDKPFERPLGYLGGNPKYQKFLRDTAKNGYTGIDLS